MTGQKDLYTLEEAMGVLGFGIPRTSGSMYILELSNTGSCGETFFPFAKTANQQFCSCSPTCTSTLNMGPACEYEHAPMVPMYDLILRVTLERVAPKIE